MKKGPFETTILFIESKTMSNPESRPKKELAQFFNF